MAAQWLLWVRCIGLVGIAHAQQSIDDVYGLLGRSLEAPLSSFSGLLPKGTFGRKVWYRSSTDTVWEGIRLAEVRYAFYREKLHTIQVRIEGAEASEAMRVLLETLFGPGKQDATPHAIAGSGSARCSCTTKISLPAIPKCA